MARLAQNSELYARYVSKLDQQEAEIEKLRKEMDTLKVTEDRQKRDLNDYLLGLASTERWSGASMRGRGLRFDIPGGA